MIVEISVFTVGSAFGTVAVGFLFGLGFALSSWFINVITNLSRKQA